MGKQVSTNTDRIWFLQIVTLRWGEGGFRYVMGEGDEPRRWSLIFSLSGRAGLAAQCLVTVPLEKAIQSFLLADGEFARLDTRVIDTEERIDVVHGLCPHICELLDLGSSILDLWRGKIKFPHTFWPADKNDVPHRLSVANRAAQRET